MKQVITIEEDNHGLIGLAETYSDAIDFLITENWLGGNTELNEFHTIKDNLGELWEILIRDEWDVEEFNNFFSGMFFLCVEPIYKAG